MTVRLSDQFVHILGANFLEDGASGFFYNFNLSTPFNTTSNFTSLIGNETKGTGFGNLAPNYIDGTMFATDDEFYIYGYGIPSGG